MGIEVQIFGVFVCAVMALWCTMIALVLFVMLMRIKQILFVRIVEMRS